MKEKLFKIVISFITGAILAAVILALAGIYPGSENTLLILDMREQFASFYASLRSLINGDASFFYTFQGSLGTAYIGMFAYYLASPYSFVTLLFDLHNLPDAIWLMDILKCASMCATFSLLMDYRGVRDKGLNLSLSLCYALSSAAVTFFVLPMYSDTLIWLPLICLFLERFLKNPRLKNGVLYSVFLSGCIYTHYYSAYMVCLFLAFYALFLLSEEETFKDIRTVTLRYFSFVLYSLLGVVLSLPLLMTVIREVFAGKVSDLGVYSDGAFIVTGPVDLLKQFICGHYGILYSEGAPNFYFSVFALILACFALYKGRNNKVKTCISAGIILIFVFSFMFRPLYRVWHMFRDPVAYPHRFAFLFVFFMLVLAGEGVKEITWKKHYNAAFLALTAVMLVFNGINITKMEIITLPSASRSEYGIFIDTTSDLVYAAKAYDLDANGPDASFCRINKDFEFSSNDPMLLGFNGMDYFSSVYDFDMLHFYKSLGFLQYHYKACDAGDTVLTSMMLGTDYLIHNGHADPGYEMITSNGFSTLSKNPYSLGCGYLAGEDKCEFGKDVFENQNQLVNSVCGYDINVLTPLEYSEKIESFTIPFESKTGVGNLLPEKLVKNTIEFTAPAGENIYLNFEILNEYELDYNEKSNSKQVIVCMGDIVLGSFTGYQKAYNIFVGNFSEETKCVITVEGSDTSRKPFIYSLDPDKLNEAHTQISGGSFNADLIKAGKIHGYVDVKDPLINTLIFTVSYSDRFIVTVDGEKVSTEPYAGGFLSVPFLDTGEHEVSVLYR